MAASADCTAREPGNFLSATVWIARVAVRGSKGATPGWRERRESEGAGRSPMGFLRVSVAAAPRS